MRLDKIVYSVVNKTMSSQYWSNIAIFFLYFIVLCTTLNDMNTYLYKRVSIHIVLKVNVL